MTIRLLDATVISQLVFAVLSSVPYPKILQGLPNLAPEELQQFFIKQLCINLTHAECRPCPLSAFDNIPCFQAPSSHAIDGKRQSIDSV